MKYSKSAKPTYIRFLVHVEGVDVQHVSYMVSRLHKLLSSNINSCLPRQVDRQFTVLARKNNSTFE